jgi:hypothetical protein
LLQRQASFGCSTPARAQPATRAAAMHSLNGRGGLRFIQEVFMKRFVLAVLALQVLVLPVVAADSPKSCTLCVGAVADASAVPAAPLPMLVEVNERDLTTRAVWIDSLTPDERRALDVVVTYSVKGEADPLTAVEGHTKTIVEWAKQHGPFASLGVDVDAEQATATAFAIKRLAVSAQGLSIAASVMVAHQTPEQLAALYDAGAGPYIDVILVDASDANAASSIGAMSRWLLEKDPAKKIAAVVEPHSANAMFDLATALSAGATRAFLRQANDAATLAALVSFNRAMTGDFAFDSTSRVEVLDAKGTAAAMPVLAFIRGEDLTTVLVPRGDAAGSFIVSLHGDDFAHPRRVDAAGVADVTDTGRRNGNFLIGSAATTRPFALTVEHTDRPDANVTREAIDVATKRGITVDEIIRNHQSYKAYEESIQPRYIARNTTKLRFTIAQGGESVEATIAGDYFSEPPTTSTKRSDWVWQDFYVNGVKWKYGRIPELPLIQPEKVTTLPLDIHLTNEYRYALVRETDVDGYHTYEVRFEPPPNAPAALPLYRGTVWIDARTWARVRISMLQLNLTGEVLSNEERVDFVPFTRTTHAELTAADVAKSDPRELIWLPREVSAQQVISAAGRASTILRATSFTNFNLDPADFDQRHKEVASSDARMVRETAAGIRYLDKNASGERVVKEGFDTSRLFLLGGIHHDAGLQFPVVPLGGLDYFNFNVAGSGIQTNVFFAGVILAANATNPNVANTRTNVGADFFGIAVPFENSMYRNGVEQKGEAVKALPLNLSLRAGHPFLDFGKFDVSLGISHITYQRAEDTAANFVVPADTFQLAPSLELQYSRWGYNFSGSYEYTKRTSWRPWGNLAEYDDSQKSFTTFGATFGKSFYLPKFQRIGVELDYLGGQRLDRFSEYELGFFGSQRIRGVRSGSVRAERALLAHLSYGFVISDQLRVEAFYDHGFLDNKLEGLHHTPYQGVGLGGQTVGPYGTLIRFDLGKTVGQNRQDGFVADVVFLKLF